MMNDKTSEQTADNGAMAIPDGTQFVIVDLDRDNELVQIEFMLDGKLMRAWVPASHLERIMPN